MDNNRLLYQIKTLEKLIGRQFIWNDMEKNMILSTPTQMLIIEYILEHPNRDIYQKDL